MDTVPSISAAFDASSETASAFMGDASVARPARILLVDDAEISRELILALLARGGYALDAVADGAAALAALENKAYDLVLMDVNMPVMDGIETAQRIRARGGRFAALPIIAMTADLRADRIAAYCEAGFSAHVGKPFSAAVLRNVVSEWASAAGRLQNVPRQTDGESDTFFDADAFRVIADEIGCDTLDRLLGELTAKVDHQRTLLSMETSAQRDSDLLRVSHVVLRTGGMLGFNALAAVCEELQCTATRGRIVEDRVAHHRAVLERVMQDISRLRPTLRAASPQ